MKKLLILILFISCAQFAHSQSFVQNLANFFEFEFKPKDTLAYPKKLVVAPIISFEPATSLGFGVGTKLLFKPKKAGAETRTSNIPISLKYTLKKQSIINSKYTIFFPQEKWLLKGELGYSKFPVSFFGLGNESLFADERKIVFDKISIEPLLLKHIAKKWFVGGGIRHVTNFNTSVEPLFENDTSGFALNDQISMTSTGIQTAITKDNRDNVLYTLTGSFFEFSHGFYDKKFGSSSNYMLTRMDLRKYFRTNPNKLNVIAVQGYWRAAWGTDVPILELSTLGGAELLRGYQESRFLDNYAYFTQVEYRWQAFDLIGFVFYGGVGDVLAKDEAFKLNTLKYSLGTGLRLKIVKSENLNIRLDYAWGLGTEYDNNIYLGIAESF